MRASPARPFEPKALAGLLLALALGSAAPAGAAPQDAPGTSGVAAPRPGYHALRASELIGRAVVNAEGERLGHVEDLILDMNTGALRYAVLAFDPGLLRGRKLFAVPTSELRLPADGDRVVYDAARQRLERGRIDARRWAAGPGDDADYLAGLDTAYGIVQPSRDQRAFRASELIGEAVASPRGDEIGAIEDLVIDMGAQKVHYAVLAFDPSWVAPEKLYAFPPRSFAFSKGGDGLVLKVDRTRLQAMESFDRDRWAQINDRAFVADIDRYLATVTPAVGTRAAPLTVFARLDSNQDGLLDRAEAARNSGLREAWPRLDKNGDGKLSRGEMSAGSLAGAEPEPPAEPPR